MAGFMKRVRKMVGGGGEGGLRIKTTEGEVEFSEHEQAAYENLFGVIAPSGSLEGEHGAAFFRRSKLPQDQLREVWRLACGGDSKHALDRSEFCMACKLIALAQNGHELSFANAVTFAYEVGVASLGWPAGPITDADFGGEIPESSISVRVTSPQSVGSGLTKHTVYSVTLSTSLEQYPLKDVSVPRRYSDFEWLHQRLCDTMPAAIVPIFPEKNRLSRMSAQFVQRRMGDLEAYLVRVTHHPTLGHSPDLIAFLTAATPEAWEAAKTYVTAMRSAETAGDDLISRVVNSGGPALTIEADEEFLKHRSFHSNALARISAAVRVAEDLHRASHEAERALGELGAAFTELGNAEADGRSASASVEIARSTDAKTAEERRTLVAASSSSFAASSSSSAAKDPDAPVTENDDDSAAQAFAKHEAARTEADEAGFGAMFTGEFDDPTLGGGGGGRGHRAGSSHSHTHDSLESTDPLVNAYRAAGASCAHASSLGRDHLDRVDGILAEKMRSELVREQEVDQAARRRDAAIRAVQAAHSLLQRRRNAYNSLAGKSGGADHEAKLRKAEMAVTAAEKSLEQRRKELDSITEGIKREMVRVMRSRRLMLAKQLLAAAKAQAVQAEGRADVWEELEKVLNVPKTEIEAAHASVKSRTDGTAGGEAIRAVGDMVAKAQRGTDDKSSDPSSSSSSSSIPAAGGAEAGGAAQAVARGEDEDEEDSESKKPEPSAPPPPTEEEEED